MDDFSAMEPVIFHHRLPPTLGSWADPAPPPSLGALASRWRRAPAGAAHGRRTSWKDNWQHSLAKSFVNYLLKLWEKWNKNRRHQTPVCPLTSLVPDWRHTMVTTGPSFSTAHDYHWFFFHIFMMNLVVMLEVEYSFSSFSPCCLGKQSNPNFCRGKCTQIKD